jgi:hypothetical protein
MGTKLSQRQIVAEIEPTSTAYPRLEGYFAQVSGGEVTAAVEKVYDGGQRFPETLCAPADIGDITVTRHYEIDRDGTKLNVLRPLVGQAYYNVVITELDCDLKVAGTQRTYTEALCVGMTEPDGDASSGAPASYSLTFSIGPLAS